MLDKYKEAEIDISSHCIENVNKIRLKYINILPKPLTANVPILFFLVR